MGFKKHTDDNLDFELGEETESLYDNDFTEDEYQQNENLENSETKEVTSDENKQSHLYILTDRKTPNLLSYMRNHGVNVSRIFNNIQEARDHLIYQFGSCRLVILETGLGKFTSINARKELVDTLGICDEGIDIAVFYTDNNVKTEATESLEIDYKRIKWYKYKSTADTVAQLLLLKETFIPAMIYDTEQSDDTDPMKFKGLAYSYKTSKHKIGYPAINADMVIEGMSNEKYDKLPSFDVEY